MDHILLCALGLFLLNATLYCEHTEENRFRATLRAQKRVIPLGGSVTLTCSVEGSTNWNYDWFRRTSELSESQIVRGGEADRVISQEGIYWCRGAREDPAVFTENSDTIAIEKIVPNRAVVTMEPRLNQIFSGEMITVRCEILGSKSIHWEYEWRRPNSNPPSKHSEQRISSASEYNSGDYMCKGRSDIYFSTEWSKPVTLIVSPRRPHAEVSADKTGLTVGDGTVKLTCTVFPPSPGWKHFWYRDDKTSLRLTKDAVFHSNGQITVSKEGYYWCRGGRGNPVYYTEYSYSIDIVKIVTYRAVVILQPQWPEIYTGETITLRCETEEKRDTEWAYEWETTSLYKPPNEHEYRIENPSPPHTGDYKCKARLKNGLHFSTEWSDSHTVTVSSRAKPVLTASALWLRPGASVTLKCEVGHPSEGWRFYWYKVVPEPVNSYRYELLPDSSGGHESYIIDGQTHTAGYVCRAGRGDPVFYTDYSGLQFVWSAYVQNQTFLSVSPDRVQHFTNESGSLSCEGNSTDWRMRWSTKDGQLSDLKGMSGSTCNINTFWHSNAVYWCESGSGQFSNAVNITIQTDDIILVSPVHPVTEGDSVTLGCKLRNENVTSNVLFYQNDKLLQNDTRVELRISAVSESDEGFYKCEYRGKVSPQSRITVKYYIMLESPVLPVTEGDSVTLACKLNTGVLLSSVSFYQNDKLIQNNTRGEMHIPAVSKSDEGFYKCKFSGKASPRSWMEVKSLSKPEKPSFAVPIITGLIGGILILICLLLPLLLLCRGRGTKGLCYTRSPQSTNQSSATDQVVNQEASQIYSSLMHGDVCIYESIRRTGHTESGINDDKEESSNYCNVYPSTTGINDDAEEDDADYCNVNLDSGCAGS